VLVSCWKTVFGVIIELAALVVSIGVVLYHTIFFVQKLKPDYRTMTNWVVLPVIYGITAAMIFLLIVETILQARITRRMEEKEADATTRARSMSTMHEHGMDA